VEGIAPFIEHTLLQSSATRAAIERLCGEALKFGFHGVCVNPHFVPVAKARGARVATVVGFPLGMSVTETKVFEAMRAALAGADEIDMVMNIGEARAGNWDYVRKDISDVVMATRGLVHKVIIECCFLTDEEKRLAALVAAEAGTEYVKTSTGFGPGGATVEDVRLLKDVVGDRAKIKAAGGIRTLAQARMLIEAGASLIGTSRGVEIVEEEGLPRVPQPPR